MNFMDPVKFLFACFAILINSILLSNDLGFIPCGHTYCTSCLRVLCGSKDTITCPECQKHHDVPKDGADVFPRNLSYQRLLDIRTRQLVSTRQCQLSLVIIEATTKFILSTMILRPVNIMQSFQRIRGSINNAGPLFLK